jgi:plastocyanin
MFSLHRSRQYGSRFSLVLAVLASFAVVACGNDDDDITDPPNGDVEEVVATDNVFTPATITVDAGTTVQWENAGEFLHTVTPDGHSLWTDTDLAVGTTFTQTFNNVGTFPYVCTIHAGMVGTVIVE